MKILRRSCNILVILIFNQTRCQSPDRVRNRSSIVTKNQKQQTQNKNQKQKTKTLYIVPWANVFAFDLCFKCVSLVCIFCFWCAYFLFFAFLVRPFLVYRGLPWGNSQGQKHDAFADPIIRCLPWITVAKNKNYKTNNPQKKHKTKTKTQNTDRKTKRTQKDLHSKKSTQI